MKFVSFINVVSVDNNEASTKMIAIINWFIFTSLVSFVQGFPSGAPNYSCRNLIPGHSNGSQTSPPPYRVDVSKRVLTAGESVKVTVLTTGDSPFLGFICAVSSSTDPGNAPVGTMSHSLQFQERDLLKLITCSKSHPDTAMTHTSRRDKVKVEFDWSPPTNAVPGQGFKLRCTVIQSFFRCWTGIQVNLSVGQTSISPQRRSNGNGNRNNLSNRGSSNNNNNGATTNSDVTSFQQPSNINSFGNSPSTDQTFSDLTSSTTPDRNIGLVDFAPTDIITDASGTAFAPNLPNQFSSSSIPSQSPTSFLPPQQRNDIFQDPGQNEIPLQIQSIDLALLIDLINMGVVTIQDGTISFNSIQSPSFHTNTINQGSSFSQIGVHPSRQIVFSRRNAITNENLRSAGVNIDIGRNTLRTRRGPNSRGLFQSSNARAFDRSFTRIRQPRIAEITHNFNHV